MELKNNIKYKKTELGTIPDDWCLKKFEDVLDGFSSGQTPYRAIKEYYRGNIPWITSGELNYNTITDTIEKITPEAVRNTNLKIIPIGTFLFAITGLEAEGTRGSCAITGIDATTNQSCMALYPKKGLILTEYLYHFYVKYGNELAFKYCQGTKQQSYTGAIAKTLPILLPPTIKEQTAIAEALHDTDAMLSELEKLIAKKQLIKQGAMQQLLKPKKYWEVKKLSEVFNFLSTANYSRAELSEYGDIYYIHYGDIHTKFNTYLEFKQNLLPTISKEQRRSFNVVYEGDLVMADASEDYEGVGKAVEVKNTNGKLAIAGLHTFLLREKGGLFINGYKGFMIESKAIKDQFFKLATGLKVYSLSKSALKDVDVFIPPKPEQINAVSVLSDMNYEIKALESKLEKYQQMKQGMMQTLLTGKVRLI